MGNDIKIEEYRSLQEEHKQNRKYIFERPILILTTLVAVSQYILKSTDFTLGLGNSTSENLRSLLKLFMFPFLSMVLYHNLKFTAYKLKSDARIVAYIQLFHEDNNYKECWIGWETSLRYYRKWMKSKKEVSKYLKRDVLKQWLMYSAERDYVDQPKSWFYYEIYYLHVFCIFVLLAIMFTVAYPYPIPVSISILIILFTSWHFLRHKLDWWNFIPNSVHHSNFEKLLENERAIWLGVYREEFIKKC